MAKLYDIVIRAPQDRIHIILGALAEERQADVLSVTPVEDVPVASLKKRIRYVGGKRNKGISSKDLFLNTLKEEGGPTNSVTRDRMGRIFVEHGFAETSVSATASALRDKIRVIGDKYQLITTPKIVA